ncbi:MAG: undecaprenyldiphospho-muramoylpentapeptide beta-N-acetylglucosaminyltransferase [bacterium]|nr:undecaprenyldiphospho-muramoylpentapeptide beta-N-acetylglucosaminyltransferase [bacterium]
MNQTRILLTGGGTGGSVAPLLAIAEEFGDKNYQFLFLGASNGPEKEMVESAGLKFKKISAGKLRRYFSLRNFFDPIFIIIGFWQAIFFILKFRPRWIVTAGSFVSVPVVWAGWLLRRKILVHQQDVRPGLANKLMAPFAKIITVTFEKSLNDYGKKARWIGNPVRAQIKSFDKKNTTNFFQLKNDLPTVLVMGGGTGAQFINDLVGESLVDLTKFSQIIHVTGKDKKPKNIPTSVSNYYAYNFLDINKLIEAYTKSAIVISRCGLSTLSELSFIKKPSILIAMPGTHQVDNARVFEEYSAAIVLDQPVLDKTFFVNNIRELLSDQKLQIQLGNNIEKVIKKNAMAEFKKIIK